MKFYIASILCLFSMIFSLTANAKTVKLVKITNQEDKKTQVFSLSLDDKSDVKSFFYKTYNGEGKELSKKTFSADKADKKMVLYRSSGKDVVTIDAYKVSTGNGGFMQVDFLYNGITGSRKSIELELRRDADDWTLRKNGKKINKMHFISNKKAIIGTIGIESIQLR
jgi:hypothetical protein